MIMSPKTFQILQLVVPLAVAVIVIALWPTARRVVWQSLRHPLTTTVVHPDPYNDPRYEKIYAPLKAGKGTKENPLTMEDLQPLMEEIARIENAKKK